MYYEDGVQGSFNSNSFLFMSMWNQSLRPGLIPQHSELCWLNLEDVSASSQASHHPSVILYLEAWAASDSDLVSHIKFLPLLLLFYFGLLFIFSAFWIWIFPIMLRSEAFSLTLKKEGYFHPLNLTWAPLGFPRRAEKATHASWAAASTLSSALCPHCPPIRCDKLRLLHPLRSNVWP